MQVTDNFFQKPSNFPSFAVCGRGRLIPTELFNEILYPLSQNSSFPKIYSRLSAVCKNWNILLNQNCLWKLYYKHVGIPLPKNQDLGLKTFLHYKNGNALLNNTKTLSLFSLEIQCPPGLLDNKKVLFVGNRYVLAYDDYTVHFYKFISTKKSEPKVHTFKNTIDSLQAVGATIYGVLDNGEVFSFSYKNFKPESFSGNHFSEEDETDEIISLLANENVVACISGPNLTLWCPQEKKKIKTSSIPSLANGTNFQIDGHYLYWTEDLVESAHLFSLDLRDGAQKSLKHFDRAVSKINIYGKKGTCLFEPDRIHEQAGLATFSFSHGFEITNKISIKSTSTINIISFEGLTLLIIPEGRSNTIYFIDTKENATLDKITNLRILGNAEEKFVQVYNGEIFVAHESNKILSYVYAKEA